MLVDFFTFHCAPCRKVIPKLNEWNEQFGDELVIIGMAPKYNSMAQLRTIEPAIEYTLAVDTGETWGSRELHVSSYVNLIDQDGVVRWEGLCVDLTTEKLKEIMDEYKK